jgi:hypothetical protein
MGWDDRMRSWDCDGWVVWMKGWFDSGAWGSPVPRGLELLLSMSSTGFTVLEVQQL